MISEESRKRLVAEWVAELREIYGSQAEIARRLGIEASQVSRWARGHFSKGLSLANLVALARLSPHHSLGDMMMAFYGVAAADLQPTAHSTMVDTVLEVGSNGTVTRRQLGHHRVMLLLPAECTELGLVDTDGEADGEV